jgi:cytochrome oxidase Cu insertion factor (SCO1/SenC/PrrC family)
MDQPTQRPPQTIWIGLVLLAVILAGAFVLTRLQMRTQPAPELPVLGAVADFSLTNQLGEEVTLADLRGKVWLADIIFTRCPGPCARMTRQMASVQAALPKDSSAQLVSLTTDPEFDTPEVLRQYAARYQADPARWQFLTGSKLAIAGLAIDSLKLTTVEKKPEERTSEDDLFIHSTIFILVDKQARLRGVFESSGEDVEWTNVQPAIISAIKQLEEER